jgi:hypothetical protein
MYFWTKNAHSKDGIYQYSNPTKGDFFLTVIPCLNTVISIMVTMDSLTGKEDYIKRKPLDFSKFFNVKK